MRPVREDPMTFKLVRRAWPRGGTNQAAQPLEHKIVSSHETLHDAEQAAESLAAKFAYHRFDPVQECWTVRNEDGPVFTLAVERQ